MSTVLIRHDYPVSAARLWALVTDYEALSEVMAGIVSFEGLPAGRAHTGQRFDVMVSLFGKLPKQPYFIEIVECDDQEMILRSSEKGSGVKSWLHTLTVKDAGTGCQLLDKIDIDAGWLTPVFVLWAKYLYRARHKPRLRLLDDGRF